MTTDGEYHYTYDAEGNRTSRFEWNDTDGDEVIDYLEKSNIDEYTWDHRNRLTGVTHRNSAGGAPTDQVDYLYDAFDQCVAKLVDSDADGDVDEYFSYLHQDGERYAEVSGDGTTVNKRYLYGAAVDQVLAADDMDGGVLWGLADHEGSVRSIIDNSADVKEVREYSAFGEILGVDPATNYLDEFPQAYTGRPWDADVEAYDNRARWYDPSAGRFLSEDPSGFSGGDANLYRYCGNNSPNNNDPSGLCWKGVGAGDSIGSTTSEKELWFNNSIPSSNFITPSSSTSIPSWMNPHDNFLDPTISTSTAVPDYLISTTSILTGVPASVLSPQLNTATQSGLNGMALYAPEDVDYQYNAVHNNPSAGEAFSHVANWAGDSITDLSVQTGYSSVAAVGGVAGSLVKSIGGVVAAFDPFYSAENIIQDISTSIDYGKEYGLAVGLARQIGLLQLAEAYVGVDIQTGKAVNWVDKVAEGAGRLGGTSLTLATGLKVTGLGGKTTPAVSTNAQLVDNIATKAERWGGRSKQQKAFADSSPQTVGTKKHGYADKLLKRYQKIYGDRGLTPEQRYFGGDVWESGMPLKGSIKLDVVEGPLRSPTAVYDYKFGKAGLTPQRINQIRNGANLSPKTPIIEVRP